MKSISYVVERALKKHLKEDIPELNYTLSNNLEVRLFSDSSIKSFREAKRSFLRRYLTSLLVFSRGNVSVAAKKANLHRRQLHRILNELNIDTRAHRRNLIKPSEYIRENVHFVLEEVLTAFPKEIDKLREVYSNIGDISHIISKEIIEEPFSYDDAVKIFEKEFISRALKENYYNIPKTAEEIEMNERTLYRKLSRLNIAIGIT